MKPGMRVFWRGLWWRVVGDNEWECESDQGCMSQKRDPGPPQPDKTDPATVGVLLQVLREAYPHHHVSTWQNCASETEPGAHAAWVQVYDPVVSETTEYDGDTLAEAAIAALEAAP